MQPALAPFSPRVIARLTSGEILEPGVRSPQPGRAACPGPNQWGSCPLALHGGAPICTGAEWFYVAASGELAWRIQLHWDSAACPAAMLDPLGPLPTPGD